MSATIDDRPCALGSPKQRAVLALLVGSPGRVVSTGVLLAELWGAEPPDTALATLQTYVSRLRASLGAARSMIIRRAPGYLLAVESEAVDVVRFERLVASARGHLAGEPVAALVELDEALALHTGEPLADVAPLLGLATSAEIQRLVDLRLTAQELRLEVKLRLGQHETVAAEATALAAEHPARETLQAIRMLALYRCDRQVEALHAYEDLRKFLSDEHGIDPGAALRGLHVRLLQQHPGLAWSGVRRPAHGSPSCRGHRTGSRSRDAARFARR